MKTIPKVTKVKLEAMTLTDLDVMHEILSKAGEMNISMETRAKWVRNIMAEKIAETFDTTENENKTIKFVLLK